MASFTHFLRQSFWVCSTSTILFAFGCQQHPEMALDVAPAETRESALSVGAATPLNLNPNKLDEFGFATALSADGSMAFVGAREDSTVKAFLRGVGGFGNAIAISPAVPVDDSAFGASVAVSADGTWLIVGAPSANVAGNQSGQAHILMRSGSTWQESLLVAPADIDASDTLGWSVAMSAEGRVAVVGAPFDDLAGVDYAGSARVFVQEAAGWAPLAVLQREAPTTGDAFGMGVAISGDGQRILVGAPFADSTVLETGAVAVFVRNGATFVIEEPALPLENTVNGDGCGYAVALNANGTTALVTCYHDNVDGLQHAGSVHVLTRQASTWTEEAVLTAPTSVSGALFGTSLALSADGQRAVIGSPLAGSGAVDVFVRSPEGWEHAVALSTTNLAADALFGYAVALSANGAQALVGAPHDEPENAEDAGGAWMFVLEGLPNAQGCAQATDCASGSCVDGVCCDTACGNNNPNDCQACVTSLTGEPNGTCAPMQSGYLCREATSGCDLPEFCNGAQTQCPHDNFASSLQMCRSARGACDTNEYCTGTSAACPADVMQPAGTSCRPAFFPCDAEDLCNGTDPWCPELFQPAGTVCNADILGPCDAPDVCTGTSTYCRPTFLPGVECRPSAGACDRGEYCSGASAQCPPDQVSSAGLVCRAVGDLTCNPMESCDGASGHCPADVNNCSDAPAPTPTPTPPPPEPRPATGCDAALPPAGAPLGLLGLVILRMRRRKRT